MVVDAHIHTFPKGALPEPMREATAQRWAYGVWPNRDPDLIRNKIEPGYTDPDGSYLIADMDAAGIDTGVVMMLDHAVGFGEEPQMPLEALFEHYEGLQEKYSGRIYVFAGVDPRREGACDLLRRAIGTHHLKGLKLYPADGYLPASTESLALLATAAELGVPVLVHTALIPYPHEGYLCNPLYLSTVQRALPSLTLIVGHAGYPIWAEEAARTVSGHPSSYLEISLWDRLLREDEERFVQQLGRFRDVVGPHRILFGSDHNTGPRFSGDRSELPGLTSFMQNLPQHAAQYGISFTQEEVNLIMGDNICRILGIGRAS